MAIPSCDGRAVVEFVLPGCAHWVNEVGEACELGIVGHRRDRALEGGAFDKGSGTQTASAGGGGDLALLGRREAEGGRDSRRTQALRV